MIVKLGDEFVKQLKNYSREDKTKIHEFIIHVQQHGFYGLKGRNKPSHNVDSNFAVTVAMRTRHASKFSHSRVNRIHAGVTIPINVNYLQRSVKLKPLFVKFVASRKDTTCLSW